MINKLSIFHDDNGTFKDLTDNLNDWTRGTKTLDFTITVDKFYLGREKAFNTVWVEISTPNAAAANLVLKYWNGTAWTTLTVDLDDTQGFTRSGWIRWTTPEDWVANSVNSTEKVWLQMTWDATFSPACILSAIGLVFSDDQDLKKVIFDISARVPSGATSHILSHVTAKDLIVDRFREQYFKLSQSTGLPKDVDEWDVFDVDQVREASKWLTLGIIFENLSDTAEDIEDVKSKRYLSRYETTISSILLSLDLNDDGQETPNEAANQNTGGYLSRA